MRSRPIGTRTWAAGAGSNGGRAGTSGSGALRHHIHLIFARDSPKQWWLMTRISGGKPLQDDGPLRFELENTFGNSGFELSSQRSLQY